MKTLSLLFLGWIFLGILIVGSAYAAFIKLEDVENDKVKVTIALVNNNDRGLDVWNNKDYKNIEDSKIERKINKIVSSCDEKNIKDIHFSFIHIKTDGHLTSLKTWTNSLNQFATNAKIIASFFYDEYDEFTGVRIGLGEKILRDFQEAQAKRRLL